MDTQKTMKERIEKILAREQEKIQQDKKYYFCSTSCRDQFLNNPERYS